MYRPVDSSGFLAQRQNETKILLVEDQLVDAWKIRFPEIGDYTYYCSSWVLFKN